MPISIQTEAEEVGVEDIIPLVKVEEITPPDEVILKVLHQNSKITRSGLPLSIRKTRIHQLILLTVLMTRVTDVEEVGIGHALAVHQGKWRNNTKHTRPLFI